VKKVNGREWVTKFYTVNWLQLAMLLCGVCSFTLSAQEEKETSKKEETTAPTSITIERSKINIAAPTSLETINKNDIKHYVDNEKIKPLLAGTADFLTLINNEITSNSKGVVILLPDWQQLATTPKNMNFLRDILPKQGWTTITVLPPNKPTLYPSHALTKEDQQKENQQTLQAYLAKLAPMMEKVMEVAKEYPGIFIVISEGSHAALLMELYQQEKVTLPNAFIVLSSYMLTAQASTQYAHALAQSDFPVLDLYLRQDHPLAQKNAPLRLALAEKEIKPYYRQQQISNTYPNYYPQEKLLIAINGWLKSIGW
jgi:hypothetical protein